MTSLALGKISSCPFLPEEIDALKQGVIDFLQTKSLSLGRHHEDRCDVPVHFLFLSQLLQAAQDHDYRRFCQKKKKWRLPDQGDPLKKPGRRDRWRSHVETEFLVNYGACIPGHRCAQRSNQQGSDLEAPRSKGPHAVSSSRRCVTGGSTQGKIRWGGEEGNSARVLFDGSNGIPVNRRIRLRDQERARAGPEREANFLSDGRRCRNATAVPVDRRDWHLLGCQVGAGGDVFINTVRTFGIASALVLLVKRCAKLAEVIIDPHRSRFLCYAQQLEFPHIGGKTSGDHVVTWVGFEHRHRSYQLGISERRAQWNMCWTKKIAASTSVNVWKSDVRGGGARI